MGRMGELQWGGPGPGEQVWRWAGLTACSRGCRVGGSFGLACRTAGVRRRRPAAPFTSPGRRPGPARLPRSSSVRPAPRRRRPWRRQRRRRAWRRACARRVAAHQSWPARGGIGGTARRTRACGHSLAGMCAASMLCAGVPGAIEQARAARASRRHRAAGKPTLAARQPIATAVSASWRRSARQTSGLAGHEWQACGGRCKVGSQVKQLSWVWHGSREAAPASVGLSTPAAEPPQRRGTRSRRSTAMWARVAEVRPVPLFMQPSPCLRVHRLPQGRLPPRRTTLDNHCGPVPLEKAHRGRGMPLRRAQTLRARGLSRIAAQQCKRPAQSPLLPPEPAPSPSPMPPCVEEGPATAPPHPAGRARMTPL